MVTQPESPGPRRPTYADIEALPEHLRGEILGGELIVTPRPAPAHVNTASVLGALLLPPFQLARGGPGGWRIQHGPELSLAADPDYDPVIPDLAGWLVESMPDLPVTAQYKTTPDWVCELLSPSTAMLDRTRKLPFYLRAGVAHVWFVDASARTLEVFGTHDGDWRLLAVHGGDETVRVPPFEDIELELALLWPDGQ